MRTIRRSRVLSRWTRPRGRIDSRALWWYASTKAGFLTLLAKPGWGVTLTTIRTAEGETAMPAPSKKRPRGKNVKKKTKAAQQIDAHHLAAVETDILSRHMGIVNHCAVTRYDDGDPRQVGWITVKTLGSAWQLEAKDPDTCCTLRVVQATLDDALGLLSMLLESEEAPWEPDLWLQQAAAKKRKKG